MKKQLLLGAALLVMGLSFDCQAGKKTLSPTKKTDKMMSSMSTSEDAANNAANNGAAKRRGSAQRRGNPQGSVREKRSNNNRS